MKRGIPTCLTTLCALLSAQGIRCSYSEGFLNLSHPLKSLTCFIVEEGREAASGPHLNIYTDQLLAGTPKVAGMLRSRLGLNKRVFARKCDYRKLNKNQAAEFLERHHLLGGVRSAHNRGLFLGEELLAVASFSAGRKMNRLKPEQRSFELIRFCTQTGITVSGGLSKLVRNFCREKNAGDIMTYVDRQLSEGRSFLLAGFVVAGERAPTKYLVDRQTHCRLPFAANYDPGRFYTVWNQGSIKMIFEPGKRGNPA